MSVEWEVDAEAFLITLPSSEAERLIRIVEHFDVTGYGLVVREQAKSVLHTQRYAVEFVCVGRITRVIGIRRRR